MGHLCDIMTIMFGFLVIPTIILKLQISDCTKYAGNKTYNVNCPLPAWLSRISPAQAYQFHLYHGQGWVIV